MRTGSLDVLNIGAGDLKFRFDRNDPEEVKKAKKVIGDMLRRGYMLFVEVDGKHKRVRKFDHDHDEYILEEPDIEAVEADESTPSAPVKSTRGGSRAGRRLPLRSTNATAVGPTAGG